MFCRAIRIRNWSASERKWCLPPLLHQPGDRLPVLLVVLHLLLGHGHEEPLFQPLGKLLEHLVLGAADEDRLERLGDFREVAVADHPAAVVDVLVPVEEAEHRPEAEAVDELDDRVQLFQPVLQRRAGQHDGVLRVELLDALGGARLPVLDPLGLVEDHHVRLPAADRRQVAADDVVVGDLVEGVGGVQFRPAVRAIPRPPAPAGRRTSRSPAPTGA